MKRLVVRSGKLWRGGIVRLQQDVPVSVLALWDEEFGCIGFRWQLGTPALPPHCLGHIGYAVVPWKKERGSATLALGLLFAEVKSEGLPLLEITTDPDNVPSQRVIVSNGEVPAERLMKPAQFGSKPGWHFEFCSNEVAQPLFGSEVPLPLPCWMASASVLLGGWEAVQPSGSVRRKSAPFLAVRQTPSTNAASSG